jgi:hypothetical protein
MFALLIDLLLLYYVVPTALLIRRRWNMLSLFDLRLWNTLVQG